MRVAIDKQQNIPKELLREQADELDPNMVSAILQADESDEAGIHDNASEFPNLQFHLSKRQRPTRKTIDGCSRKPVQKECLDRWW